MPLRERLHRLGVGRAAYLLLHRPLSAARASLRDGGPLEQWRTKRGREAMEAAAHHLPPLPAVAAGAHPLEVYLLTGRRFWYQTAFCLHTLARQAQRRVYPVIYDDGTLGAREREPLQRLFPEVRFIPQVEAIVRLDQFLPVSRFPHLRDRWQHYPNIRKLIDPHLNASGWKLVIDSDLLFFRRPDFLIDWLAHPSRPLHAIDCESSYGYSRSLMDTLAGAPLAELVNVGLCGLRSDDLDWEKIEAWCRTLIAREGTSYYLEQALVAMLGAGQSCDIAPVADYVTLPRLPEARDCRAVMHHYVADSKSWYFRHNWRRAQELAG